MTHGCEDRDGGLDGRARLGGELRGLGQRQWARCHGYAHGLGGTGDLADGGGTGFGALRGVLFQQVQNDVGEGLGDEVRQWRHRVVDVRERDVDLGFAREGAPTSGGLVSDDAEGVEVTDGRGGLAHRLFGRQVLGGTHDHARGGQIDLVPRAGDAEVGQFHHAVRANEDVRRLDVAVHDACACGGTERHRDLHEDRHEVFGLNACATAQIVRQRVAVDEFHDDPADAVFFTRILGVRNVRVRDRHRVAGLEAQARQREFLACQLGT